MSDTKYQVGDVIGTVTLVVGCVDVGNVDYPYSLETKEMPLGEGDCEDLLTNFHSEDELEEISFKLAPSKRKEQLLKQRAEIDKQLEELGNE